MGISQQTLGVAAPASIQTLMHAGGYHAFKVWHSKKSERHRWRRLDRRFTCGKHPTSWGFPLSPFRCVFPSLSMGVFRGLSRRLEDFPFSRWCAGFVSLPPVGRSTAVVRTSALCPRSICRVTTGPGGADDYVLIRKEHGIGIRRKGRVSVPLGPVMNIEQVTQDVTTEGGKLTRYADSYFIDSWEGFRSGSFLTDKTAHQTVSNPQMSRNAPGQNPHPRPDDRTQHEFTFTDSYTICHGRSCHRCLPLQQGRS